MIVPNPKFRPNPSRAIYINSGITDELLFQLTPQILQLQDQNRDPITLYILNSPGGRTASMKAILGLLKESTQDEGLPCDLITVVTGTAASAAADLLSSGDYAIAYPASRVFYHGVRTQIQNTTVEEASFLAGFLRMSNDRYANELARKIEFRFLFRFVLLRHEFPSVRQQNAPRVMSDLDCFLSLVSEKLSAKGQEAIKKGKDRFDRYAALLTTVLKRVKKLKGPKRPAEMEALFINAIIAFELSENKRQSDWTFKSNDGLARLVDDFFLLNEYLESFPSARFKVWCRWASKLALSPQELAEVDSLPDEQSKDAKIIEKLQPILRPLFSFFIAMCHVLQEGEYDLTAVDAYWLGLVDEVWGQSLPTTRLIEEFRPDQLLIQAKLGETKGATTEEADPKVPPPT